MRIIAGKFKGRTLDGGPDRSIRPTTDRVKESMFNLIQGRTEGAAVLDLFAGSGALGIEALSRGADSVTFCDRQPSSVAVLRKNLQKVDGNLRILQRDWRASLAEFGRAGDRFDLIFLDPPYDVIEPAELLSEIVDRKVLKEDGLIVFERPRGGKPPVFPTGTGLIDSRDYGATTLDLIGFVSKVAVTGTFDPFTKGHLEIVREACRAFDEVHVVVLVNPDKKTWLSPEKRIQVIEAAVKTLKRRITVAYSEGLAIDYCKAHDIGYIMRGVRNENDFAYEKEMAEWNLKHGGIKTLFVQTGLPEISSTAVREALAKGEGVGEYLVPQTIKLITEGAEWKT